MKLREDGVSHGNDRRYGNSAARAQDAEVDAVKKELQNQQVQSGSGLFIVAPFLHVQIVSMHRVWFVQEGRVEEGWRHKISTLVAMDADSKYGLNTFFHQKRRDYSSTDHRHAGFKLFLKLFNVFFLQWRRKKMDGRCFSAVSATISGGPAERGDGHVHAG